MKDKWDKYKKVVAIVTLWSKHNASVSANLGLAGKTCGVVKKNKKIKKLVNPLWWCVKSSYIVLK